MMEKFIVFGKYCEDAITKREPFREEHLNRLSILKDRNVLVFSFQGNVYCTLLCKLLGVKVIIRSNSAPDFWSQNKIKHHILQISLKLKTRKTTHTFGLQLSMNKGSNR